VDKGQAGIEVLDVGRGIPVCGFYLVEKSVDRCGEPFGASSHEEHNGSTW